MRLNERKEVGEQGQADSVRKRDERCHPRKRRLSLLKHNCTAELAAGRCTSKPFTFHTWLAPFSLSPLTRMQLCLVLEMEARILLEK